MSIDVKNDGDVIHYPKRRDVFEFDDEVTRQFDNMAERSIPMYREVHRLHVSLLHKVLSSGKAVVADIGSSTGKTIAAIRSQINAPVKVYAIDSSQHMADELARRFPDELCKVVCGYVPDIGDLPEPVDVIFAYYVLQFVRYEDRNTVLQWLVRNVKPGGFIVFGHKTDTYDASIPIDTYMRAEYIKFRRDNGYTVEEIEAKTEALRNSMWEVEYDYTARYLRRVGCDSVIETSRWLQFCTCIAMKKL